MPQTVCFDTALSTYCLSNCDMLEVMGTPIQDTGDRSVRTTKVMALVALLVSIASSGIAGYSAYQSRISAQAATAGVRPILLVDVPSPVESDDSLNVPVIIKNIGKTRAAVRAVRLVYWRKDATIWRTQDVLFHELSQAVGVLVQPEESTPAIYFNVPRMVSVSGSSIDLSRGLDAQRRLCFEIEYVALDLDREVFTDRVMTPVEWRD
jgi:hypothetical protein